MSATGRNGLSRSILAVAGSLFIAEAHGVASASVLQPPLGRIVRHPTGNGGVRKTGSMRYLSN